MKVSDQLDCLLRHNKRFQHQPHCLSGDRVVGLLENSESEEGFEYVLQSDFKCDFDDFAEVPPSSVC